MIKKDLYKIIYYFIKIRETELSIAKYYSDKKMRCPVHLSVGQESISAALSAIYDKMYNISLCQITKLQIRFQTIFSKIRWFYQFGTELVYWVGFGAAM